MLYHRWSLLSLLFYLRFGLFRARPFRSIDEIMAAHQESPGTKVYNKKELQKLFSKFQSVAVHPILTPYDVQFGRDWFMPEWMCRILPDAIGYFLVVTATKPIAHPE